jgi:hypothetical protein
MKMMISNFLKNETPYKGNLKLKFEKYPHYTGGSPWSKLNKVHLNLGFTKLVSRIYPIQTLSGKEYDPNKIESINRFTRGKIETHEWWVIKGEEGKENPTVTEKPNDDVEVIYHGVLENSFMSEDGVYMGDACTGWWYVKNQFVVCDEYPHGVAVQLTEKAYREHNWNINEDNVVGYYGYTHRGGSLFKIGDRLFDPEYTPIKTDYPPKEWEKYEKEYNKGYENADEFDKKWIYGDGIKSVIPFKQRGGKIIETLDEAREAAINMSKHLS